MMHVVALHHGWMKEHRLSNASSHAHTKILPPISQQQGASQSKPAEKASDNGSKAIARVASIERAN
jgi:hypothetical protein